MFKLIGKLVSAKQKVLRLVRLIGNSGKEDHTVTAPPPAPTVAPYEPVNLLTNYPLELKKAKALEHWRRMERPK